ncbi:amidohydrolase family protein [Aminobacter sp. SR38]|jgi:cytosine/adenosine deaminase-related metal-dependent hydrolase|uniref:amidohydrolase family protein n=1 Tax=Aminobacter TaxID=31988 RepID=UPI0017821656|nr:amidohydrolase family protein [Aminobacter sp. SR38]QOF72710.1 amidohydrolase family protein [Aminobacter sp. SR38]
MSHSGSTDSGAPASKIGRRGFLKATLVMGAAAAAPVGSSAQTQGAAAGNPALGNEFVIRAGHILSMDGDVGDFASGEVHVKDGRIVAVGERLSVAGIEAVDATDMIVMPGFVDTHSHLWNAFLRGSIRGDDPVRGYFPTTNRAASLCTPDDAAASARFGLLEALLSGTTCINNFCHNTRSVEHANAEIRASIDLGVRTRYSYGTPGRGERLDTNGVEAVRKQWATGHPLITIGVNLQTPAPDILKSGGDDDKFVAEARFAKELGLPISLHYGNTAHGLVGFMDKHGLLGPHLLFIHAQGLTEEERETLVAKNVQFSMSPAIEIPYSTVRNGYIQFAELEQLGASLSLSVDASSAMATADFFTVMRALQWSHKQRADVDRTLEPKRILEIATLGGARALGLDREIGSLTPGKKADIILVRKTDLNIAPVIDPYFSLVFSGGARNVDTVIVDGVLVVKSGQHVRVDGSDVVAKAEQAGRAMHEKLEHIIANTKESVEQLNKKG